MKRVLCLLLIIGLLVTGAPTAMLSSSSDGSGSLSEPEPADSGQPDNMIANPASSAADKYTIILFDRSPSVKKQLEIQKDAAKKACEELLKSDHYVAIITFASTAAKLTDFTKDIDTLTRLIDPIKSDGASNIGDALNAAEKLFQSAGVEENKNILLMTDGYPNRGAKSAGNFGNKYANASVTIANKLWVAGINIATVCFLKKMGDSSKKKTEDYMRSLQNTAYCSISFESPPDFSITFAQVVQAFDKAETTKVRRVIYLNGPVDFRASYNNRYLSNSAKNLGMSETWGSIEYLDSKKFNMIITLYTDEPVKIELKGKKGTVKKPATLDYSIEEYDADSVLQTTYFVDELQFNKKTNIATSSDKAISNILQYDNGSDGSGLQNIELSTR